MTTFGAIATRTGTQVPAHLEAQAEIKLIEPGMSGRQGDVYIVSTTLEPKGEGKALTGKGHKVVVGDADRNSHILNGDGLFYEGKYESDLLDYGLLVVPAGGSCYLTHTSEHGSIGVAEGTYRVFGQVEYAAEMRRASD